MIQVELYKYNEKEYASTYVAFRDLTTNEIIEADNLSIGSGNSGFWDLIRYIQDGKQIKIKEYENLKTLPIMPQEVRDFLAKRTF